MFVNLLLSTDKPSEHGKHVRVCGRVDARVGYVQLVDGRLFEGSKVYALVVDDIQHLGGREHAVHIPHLILVCEVVPACLQLLVEAGHDRHVIDLLWPAVVGRRSDGCVVRLILASEERRTSNAYVLLSVEPK
jgi:hypothetical protein